MACKKAMMVFSNFSNFYAIFLEFSITGREETQRNDFLPFLSFVAFPNQFWLETKLWWYFLYFSIFLEPSITGRVETQRNDFFYFLVKKLRWCFLIFLIFLLFLSNARLRVGKKHNGTIYCLFSLSWPFPTYFGLKRSCDGIF